MPYIPKEQRQQGLAHARDRVHAFPLPWDDWPPIPAPDQSRYGPHGTTDTPRFRADGHTPWPRETENKGDRKR